MKTNNKNMKIKNILTTILLTTLFLWKTSPAQAACNFHQSMSTINKDVSWSQSCTIDTGTINGIDKGTGSENTALLTISSGSITINANAKLITGSLLLNGSNIAVQDTGTINIGAPIYITDADADGYPTNFTLYDTTASGRRRLSLMSSFTTADCGDSTYSTTNTCCTIATRYRDVDGDGYGAGASSQRCPTAGYVTNNSDCYDSNANARPGSTYCGTTHRGDGSYDYNCSGTQTKCSPVLTYTTNTRQVYTRYTTGKCAIGTYKCHTITPWPTIYDAGAVACGQPGGNGCNTISRVNTECDCSGDTVGGFNACTAITVVTQKCQ